jgi:hypothetical protein
MSLPPCPARRLLESAPGVYYCARARDILRQFLVEAVVLCLLGGAMGIFIGRGGSDGPAGDSASGASAPPPQPGLHCGADAPGASSGPFGVVGSCHIRPPFGQVSLPRWEEAIPLSL